MDDELDDFDMDLGDDLGVDVRSWMMPTIRLRRITR